MTIKTECVIKHLKHDYKELGKVVAFLMALLFLLTGGIYIVMNMGSIIDWCLKHSPTIPIPSAYLSLNAFAAILVLSFTVGIAVFGTKKSFVWKEVVNNEYDKSATIVEKDHESGDIICIAYLFAIMPYLFYAIIWGLSNGAWESPVASAIVFFVLILIGTPIGCAIARCKE